MLTPVSVAMVHERVAGDVARTRDVGHGCDAGHACGVRPGPLVEAARDIAEPRLRDGAFIVAEQPTVELVTNDQRGKDGGARIGLRIAQSDIP